MSLFKFLKKLFPYYKEYVNFVLGTHYSSTYLDYIKYKMGLKKIYWPMDKTTLVGNPRSVFVGINSLVGRPCSYIQGQGTIYIGNYVQFGPNVGIVSTNHDLYDQRCSNNGMIKIGDYSWIGMGSVITAGVELGPRTIVGANSVVTKSFPDGFCVIAGNPAKLIKQLDKSQFVPWYDSAEYYGYIPKAEFEKKRSKYIDL